MSLQTDISQLQTDATLIHAWSQGDAATSVTMGGVPVRSPARLIADKDAAINAAANGILAQATDQAVLATTNGQVQVAAAAVKVAQATTLSAAADTARIAAETARTQAQAAQSAVEAAGVNPAIRIGPNRIAADFTVPADYNALSVGPVEIATSTTITLSNNSIWRIA